MVLIVLPDAAAPRAWAGGDGEQGKAGHFVLMEGSRKHPDIPALATELG